MIIVKETGTVRKDKLAIPILLPCSNFVMSPMCKGSNQLLFFIRTEQAPTILPSSLFLGTAH